MASATQDRKSSIDTAVGGRIASARMFCGISDLHLASRAGLEAERLARIESGNIRADAKELYNIAKALGIPISYFFAD